MDKAKEAFLMIRLGWFSTGRDEAARQLLQVVYQAIHEGAIKAKIAFVFSSRSPGESPQSDLFINLVKSYSIPCIYLSYEDFTSSNPINGRKIATRNAYDWQVVKLLKGLEVDLCVLAGYMLIVSPKMCRHYPMINLHPAAPGGPKGAWQEVIWQLMEQRAITSGVMMHLVTPELDRGPAVTYCTYSLRTPKLNLVWKEHEKRSLEEIKRREGENDTLFRLIRQEGLKREFPLILATIKAFSQRHVRVEKGIILNEEGNSIPGYDLTSEIEGYLEIAQV